MIPNNFILYLGICDSGFEINATGHCVPCPIGYTKDNNIQRASDRCQPCPETLITPSVGSISQDNCTIGKY